MKVIDLTINTESSLDRSTRAKITTIDINSKKMEFPKKSIHSSPSNTSEIDLIGKNFEKAMVNEISLQIRPKQLREIVSNPKEHQKIKENIRNMLSESNQKNINIAYPFLYNVRSPNELEEDFKPFGRPTKKMMEKIFDLFDIEGIDVIIFPSPSPNGNSLDWCKMATDIFPKRKHDFLDEAIFSGSVPLGNPNNHVKEIIDYYLKNKIQSFTFDFFGLKVLESRMREIIEENVGEKWKDMYVHATNVPAFPFSKWREPILGTYDVLVSVYGFDSFGGIVKGGGSSKVKDKKQLQEAIKRKRFRLMETYGDYTLDGLKRLSENTTIQCNSPIWKSNDVFEIYDRTPSNQSLQNISNEMRGHRNYVTHKEVNTYSKLIKKDRFLTHIKEKKASAKELSSILDEFRLHNLSEF